LGNGRWERHALTTPNQLFGESIVTGDFTGDGRPGFATSTSVMDRDDIVNQWKPNNGWQAVAVNQVQVRPMAYVWSVAAADFDGDGCIDLAVAYTSFELETWRSGVDVLLSRPGGHWGGGRSSRQKLARVPSRSQLATSKATDTRTWSH
jgi:hypothetical protein